MRSSRPPAPARPAAVLWDMDGTIVDTEPYWIECEYELVAEFGGHWDDQKAHSIVGLDLRDSARVLQERGNVQMPIDDIVNRLLDGVIERVRRRVPWRPGARELLADLNEAGIPCALVTMSWSRFAHAVVEALPPGSFVAVVTGDMVQNGKPHPEPYITAAHSLGAEPSDCVAIEDSPTGVRSAVAAGCRTVAVPNVVDVPPSDQYLRLSSLTDLDPAVVGLSRPGRARVSSRRAATLRRRPVRTRPLIALGVVAALATSGALLLRDDEPAPLPVIAMGGWAPYWVIDDATVSVTNDGELFRDISPFWFEARGARDVQFAGNLNAERVKPFMDAARASGAKIIPAVADVMEGGDMARLLADDERRAAHVETLVELARTWDVDGLDIDYERFAFVDDRSTWPTTTVHWVTFITELADALHADGRLITVAVPPIYDNERSPTSGYWVYDYPALGRLVDQVRIMAYDYSIADPGPLAPLDWVRTSVLAAKDAIDDDSKIVLGIPLYGRNWVTSTIGTCPEGAPGRVDPNLREIEGLLEKYGPTPVYDEITGDEVFTYQREFSDTTGSCTQTREVHFVGANGARARVDLARAERIGGVVFWALGFDTPAVWDALRDLSRRPTA